MKYLSDAKIVGTEVVDYGEDHPSPGYEKDLIIDVEFGGRQFRLLAQPTEPVYLSADWIAREQDGVTTGPWALNYNETEDGTLDLADAICAQHPDADRDDVISEICEFASEFANAEAEAEEG
jgi:hypothetical protein